MYSNALYSGYYFVVLVDSTDGVPREILRA